MNRKKKTDFYRTPVSDCFSYISTNTDSRIGKRYQLSSD